MRRESFGLFRWYCFAEKPMGDYFGRKLLGKKSLVSHKALIDAREEKTGSLSAKE